MSASVGFLATLLLGAVPELTQPQRIQLDTATDLRPRFDGPAIFPLLRNAMQWEAPVSRAGAMIPDPVAIVADPQRYRGTLFLIEGDLARVVHTGELAQPGPWDGSLREWDVVMSSGLTAVVFLVDPPIDPPPGRRVEIVARFYMVMRRRDVSDGRSIDFPVFVGRTARADGRGTASAPGGSTVGWNISSLPIAPLVATLSVVAGYVLLRLWMRRGRRGAITSRHARRAGRTDSADAAVDDREPPLPRDPAEALDELAQRKHGES